MRILQVTSAYYPELQFGGPPQKIHALSRGLSARGHDVRVVTLNSRRRSASEQALIEGIAVQYLPWAGKGAWQAPVGWRPLVNAVHWAELVHCYGLYNLLCPLAARLARGQDKPFLIEPQGMAVARAGNLPLKRLYHRFFTAYLLRQAACVVATSPAEADEVKQWVTSERLEVRRNGIDLEMFRNLPSGVAFRERFGIPGDARVALFVGRISPIKNLEMLVRAFAVAKVPHSRLVLVGPMLEPDYTARLRTLCAELGLGEAVLLTGPMFGFDKLAALAAADLFVLPSLSESYGNAAAEAVAAGLPVLLTETCGIAHQIHGRAGLAVPVEESALASALRALLTDSGQLTAVTSGRDGVLAELSWKEPLDQTEHLYHRITSRLVTPAAMASADIKTTS